METSGKSVVFAFVCLGLLTVCHSQNDSSASVEYTENVTSSSLNLEPNTPNPSRSILEELKTEATTKSSSEQELRNDFLFSIIPPDPNRYQKRLPTVLQEAQEDFLTNPTTRTRHRHWRARHQNHRNEFQTTTREINQPPSPEKFLENLLGIGSKFIQNSLSLITGRNSGSGNNEESFGNADFSNAVGYVRNSSRGNSLQEQLRDFNPIQLLINRFNTKQNKLQRWREIKDRFKQKEVFRRVKFFADDSPNQLSRYVKNGVRRMINWYEKNTDTMQLLVDYRKQKLQTFLGIPIVVSLLGSEESTTNDVNLIGEQETEDAYTSTNAGHDEGHSDEEGHVYNEEYQDREPPRTILTPIVELSRNFVRFMSNI